MKGISGLLSSGNSLGQVIERWADAGGLRFKGDPETPSAENVTDALELVRAGLSVLGPPDLDEPHDSVSGSQIPMVWGEFSRHFIDRRTLSDRSLRDYLQARTEPPEKTPLGKEVSWQGLLRGWLRMQLALLSQSIIMDTPAFYREDPNGLRPAAFEGLKKVILMLPDRARAGCLELIGDRVPLQVEALATALYHRPDAGPAFKETVEEVFKEPAVQRIKANPPATFEEPPWLPEP